MILFLGTNHPNPALKKNVRDDSPKIRGCFFQKPFAKTYHNPVAGWLSGFVLLIPADSIGDPLAAWRVGQGVLNTVATYLATVASFETVPKVVT